uniref:hypothetical protein n=1 Tax=Sphingomonas sp. AR_OL41 TaxID=3042729 RepID=UPI0024810FB4|nr:hypothetical protein [Sphingomonas sp. AR_OL41]
MSDIAETWDDDDHVPKRPIITTIVGFLVVGWACHGSPDPTLSHDAVRLAIAALFAIVTVPLIWLICFAVALRKASTGWKVGSFMTFLLLGFLVKLGSLGPYVPPPPVPQATAPMQMVIPGVDDISQLRQLPSADPHRERHRRKD